MSRVRPEFVEFIPPVLQPGVLYISERYHTASHLCACGCGEKVVTPLSPADWRLVHQDGYISLYPSIGNWNYECRSHYWIRRNEIVWSGRMSSSRIAHVQERDRLDKVRLIEQRNRAKSSAVSSSSAQPIAPDTMSTSFWARLGTAIKRFLRRS